MAVQAREGTAGPGNALPLYGFYDFGAQSCVDYRQPSAACLPPARQLDPRHPDCPDGAGLSIALPSLTHSRRDGALLWRDNR